MSLVLGGPFGPQHGYPASDDPLLHKQQQQTTHLFGRLYFQEGFSGRLLGLCQSNI